MKKSMERIWMVFTIILLAVFITLASHMSYVKARHFKSALVVSSSKFKPKQPVVSSIGVEPGSTVLSMLSVPLAPSSTASPETMIAWYEMVGMVGTAFFGFLGIIVPILLQRRSQKEEA